MTDDTSAALERLKEIASRRDDGVAMCLWSEEARAILAHIAALEARAERAEAERERLASINADLCRSHNALNIDGAKWQARAETAEAKVAAAEERGLVFNTLPDGRLDFCAIREGSRLWEDKVRAEVALRAARAEGIEAAAKVAEGVTDYSDSLQRASGCLTAGERAALAIRALLTKESDDA